MTKSAWMTLADRERIEKEYNEGMSVRKIAEGMGRHFAGIYRELQHGYTGEMDKNGRPGYSAEIAQRRSYELTMKRREKTTV